MEERSVRILVVGALAVLSLGVPAALGQTPAAPQTPEETRFETLITQATAFLRRSVGPRPEEQRLAEQAMKELEQEKDAVTRYIVARLKKWGTDTPSRLMPAHYGWVLWSFGPKHVLALEPDVLGCDDERAREAGVRVLGSMGGYPGVRDVPEIADLVIRVLERDKSAAVQVAALNALIQLRVSKVPEIVVPRLDSERPEVRKAALLLCLGYPFPEARPALEARLTKETDRGMCFLLARTLVKYDGYPWQTLLASDRPGVREAVLFALNTSRGGEFRLTEQWRVALPLIETERDPQCRARLGFLLGFKHDPRCIPLLIETVGDKRLAPAPDSDFDYRTAAAADLANLTGAVYGIADEDRRSGRDVHERVAQRYAEWWKENGPRVRWSDKEFRFVVDGTR